MVGELSVITIIALPAHLKPLSFMLKNPTDSVDWDIAGNVPRMDVRTQLLWEQLVTSIWQSYFFCMMVPGWLYEAIKVVKMEGRRWFAVWHRKWYFRWYSLFSIRPQYLLEIHYRHHPVGQLPLLKTHRLLSLAFPSFLRAN